ncbi:hypothetical protein L313_1476 [Acinetobacter haemolyticus CIP 64.3 = MTCC 9819]|nr:hypothetical protein L313_1476 [Acinetobacter haemolyticus CIP 64.3 = MTCC 9819]
MKPYNKNLKLPSRDLRSNMTDAEQLLWSRLRRKQILGNKIKISIFHYLNAKIFKI